MSLSCQLFCLSGFIINQSNCCLINKKSDQTELFNVGKKIQFGPLKVKLNTILEEEEEEKIYMNENAPISVTLEEENHQTLTHTIFSSPSCSSVVECFTDPALLVELALSHLAVGF